MPHANPNRRNTWSLALAAATLSPAPLTAAPLNPFEVTFLEAPANPIKIEPSMRSGGINLQGEVAGRTFYRDEAELPGFVLMQGVHWNAAGSPSLLPHYDGPTYGVFNAEGINDAGQIAGMASPRTTGDYNSRAVRWEADGSVTTLEEPSNGDVSGAYAINNAGQVAGYARPYVGIRAARWEADGSLEFLGVLPDYDPFNNHSEAYAIADSGYAAGFYDSNINDAQAHLPVRPLGPRRKHPDPRRPARVQYPRHPRPRHQLHRRRRRRDRGREPSHRRPRHRGHPLE